MDVDGVAERAARVAAVCCDSRPGRPAVRAALVDLQQLRAWVDAREAALVTHLSDVEAFPEATIAETSKTSLHQAARTRARAGTIAALPSFEAALTDGDVTSAHLDVVTMTSNKLAANQRTEFLDRVDALAPVASASTVAQFRQRLDLEVRRLQVDDGLDRLERARRNCRARSWVDVDGMWNLRGRFDPVTGVTLSSRLDAAIEALFAESTPAGCPDDPVEKQQFLAAHALARMIDGSHSAGSKAGRPEFVVVVDTTVDDVPRGGHGGTDPHQSPTCDSQDSRSTCDRHTLGTPPPWVEWPIPVEVPWAVLAEMATSGDRAGDVQPVIVGNGVVLHAPGQLDLGRSTRLANRAQRRALRGLYRSCAIPGCSVAFSHCKLHHVVWWRHGGSTDLHNLLPVCAVHHGKIHHDGWGVSLGPRRQLTLRLPDGSIRNTGPPNRTAA